MWKCLERAENLTETLATQAKQPRKKNISQISAPNGINKISAKESWAKQISAM